MKNIHAIAIAALAVIAMGCDKALASRNELPARPTTRQAQKLADGTCGARFIHDSLISEYVPYGASCKVPADSMKAHEDGSMHADTYGAGVAYQTWITRDGDCDPREWAIDSVKNFAACLRNPPRWMYDSAYRIPRIVTWGM